MKVWVRAECSPESILSMYGELAEIASRHRQHGAQAVAHLDRPVGALDADVDLQRERVVAPGDVLEAVLDAVVVRRVDDVLLAVVRQRVRAGRAEPHAVGVGQLVQPPARLLLLGAGVGDVLPAAGADLDLGRDQLAADRNGEHGVGGAGVAQLLELGDQLERLGMDERVFLLDTDREVLGGLEGLARSGEVDQLGQCQVEVERVEEVDGRARRVDRDLRRHLQERLRVVEDDLDAGLDQPVGELLGGDGGHREHADDDVLLLHDRLDVVGVADLDAVDVLPHLAAIGVEDRHHAEAVVGEDVRRGDRAAEVAGAEQRDVVLPAGAQDLADLRDQRVDVVADAALAELAEARQVAPDLGRVHVRVLGQLLAGDRLLAHLARLREHLQVA